MPKLDHGHPAWHGLSVLLRAVVVGFILGVVTLFAFGSHAEQNDERVSAGAEPSPDEILETYAAVQGNEVFNWQADVTLLDDGRLLVPFENVTDKPLRVTEVAVGVGMFDNVHVDGGLRENRVDFTLQTNEKLDVYLVPPVRVLEGEQQPLGGDIIGEQQVLTLWITYEQSGETKTTGVHLLLDEYNINGVMQDRGTTFLVSDIQEMTVPPTIEGTQLFSVAGKVRVDAIGEIRTNTDLDGTEYAEQDREFTLLLEASQTVTVTAISVVGIDNDFSAHPVTLTPGKAVGFKLQGVPPVVMSVGNFESLAVDVEGTIGGAPFTESFTLNLHSADVTGTGHLQGSIVPKEWEREGLECPIEMRRDEREDLPANR